MNARQLNALRALEQHTFECHPQRILDLLYVRKTFVDTRETCPDCVRLLLAMGAERAARELEAAR